MVNKTKMNLYGRYLLSQTIYSSAPIYNFNWIKKQSFYSKILGNLTIKFVDVGARHESSAKLQPLQKHLDYVGFEAEGRSTRHVSQFNEQPWVTAVLHLRDRRLLKRNRRREYGGEKKSCDRHCSSDCSKRS